MIPDFETFVTWMYVIIDDLWHTIAHQYRRPGPPPQRVSDSERITMAMVGELRGWDREGQLLAEWAAYRHLFPHLPERSRFNRRRRNLWQAINHIRQQVLTRLDLAADGQVMVDSMPIPVLAFHLAPQRDRQWDAHGATFGYCASKNEPFLGYRLHLVVTLGGLMVDFTMASADADERDVADGMLRQRPGSTVLGDKGYVSAPWAQDLADDAEVQMLAVRRSNQRRPLPPTLKRWIGRFRQRIETVNSQLSQQLHIQDNHACTFWGLCARLYTKLAAHTLAIAINRWIGNPNWLQIANLVFSTR
jgi:Transposase DDE domain